LADSMPGTIRLAQKNPSPGKFLPPTRPTKKVEARDTKLAVGRELTKGNSSSARFFEDTNRTDCSVVNLTGTE